MDVILLRHGETYWNASKKMQGRTDIPLNENGKKQASAASALLPPIDYCLTSPMNRAVQTAQLALGEQRPPVVCDPLLLEQSYGICEATNKRIANHWPWHVMYNYEHHPEKYNAPIGAQSFEKLYQRTEKFVQESLIPLQKKYNTVLVSGHGAFFRALLGRLLNIPITDFWSVRLKNGGIFNLKLENGRLYVPDAEIERRKANGQL